MAAFNYLFSNTALLVPGFADRKVHYVSILLTNGQYQLVRWVGFRPLTDEMKPDHCHRFAKMAAISVSSDGGFPASNWRILKPGEFVLSWLKPYDASSVGVYTVLGKDGAPWVMGNVILPMAV